MGHAGGHWAIQFKNTFNHHTQPSQLRYIRRLRSGIPASVTLAKNKPRPWANRG